MDTGYVQLLDADDRERVLDVAAAASPAATSWPARSWPTSPAHAFDLDAYLARGRRDRASRRHARDLPVARPQRARRRRLGRRATPRSARALDRFIGFELGAMFVPYGRIVSPRRVPRPAGAPAVHRRQALVAEPAARVGPARPPRRASRPDFHVFTGNDLAIDMVMYGSDYLLGLSTFAPEAFAERDRLLGATAIPRSTSSTTCCSTSARSRSAPRCPRTATTPRMFLQLAAGSDATRPRPARRAGPTRDRAVLADIAERLDAFEASREPAASDRYPQVKRLRHRRRAPRPARGLGIDDESASTTRWIRTDRSRPRSRSSTASPARSPSPTGSRSCRWRDGTAPRPARPTDLVRRRWDRFGESGCGLVWGARPPRSGPTAGPTPTSSCSTARTVDDIAALRDARARTRSDRSAGLQLTHSGRWSPADGRAAAADRVRTTRARPRVSAPTGDRRAHRRRARRARRRLRRRRPCSQPTPASTSST